MTGKSTMPIIRKMTLKDLKPIIEIDSKILGAVRPGYWETKLINAEKNSPVSSLVAEIDGRPVGFLIGGASGWEYGVPESTGLIDAVGVDPEYQRRGIATLLFREMAANLKKVGVNRVTTFVTWSNWELLKFFNTVGFKMGKMVNLEYDI
ncbi:MAG: GNAT family N-acetyltransferase [Deltaproteobacteria bacterium]|nr:GNAT family N-acetyltransferase [Deltaproteobacteria bacterium]